MESTSMAAGSARNARFSSNTINKLIVQTSVIALTVYTQLSVAYASDLQQTVWDTTVSMFNGVRYNILLIGCFAFTVAMLLCAISSSPQKAESWKDWGVRCIAVTMLALFAPSIFSYIKDKMPATDLNSLQIASTSVMHSIRGAFF